MTLFEPEAPVAVLADRRHPQLPRPHSARWAPLRAGILNVWEYDEQQFWFADGRLLLRGRNEAGKSKALELLFPFALDGDMSPHKLDPFDSSNKSMGWNLVGFDPANRTSVIGYVWIEFGRLDEAGEPVYCSTIVGLQMTRAEAKPTSWFAVTPQRVDADLPLTEDDRCLIHEKFRAKVEAGGGRFTRNATEHRFNVASVLFGMELERFENLLHLLRQLRKPRLAEKLDVAKLSKVLSDALPPLDAERIEPLARAFASLDEDIESLRRVEAQRDATAAFLTVYRAYAHTVARRHADSVRNAETALDNVTRQERDAIAAVAQATEDQERLKGEGARVAEELADTQGKLAGLDLSSVEKLEGLEAEATHAADQHAAAAEAAGLAENAAADAAAAKNVADEEAAAAGEHLNDAWIAARRLARTAHVDDTWDGPDAADAATALRRLLETRKGLLAAVTAAAGRAAKAQQEIVLKTQAVTAAAAAEAEAADQAAARADEAGQARDDLAAELEDWAGRAPARAGNVDVDHLLDEAHTGQKPYRAAVLTATKPLTDAARSVAAGARSAAETAGRRRNAAVEALEAHDRLPDETPPPARPGIGAPRSGIPLWRVVEFVDVDSTTAALVEAALEAAGLLDAVVSEHGLTSVDDTVIVPAAATATGGARRWLKAAADSPVDGDVVARVLAGIGSAAGDGGCWISEDGSWGNGPLQGRWAKPSAEFIGAAARAARRARERERLVAEVEESQAAYDVAVAEAVAAEEAATAVQAWANDEPPIDAYVRAESRAADAADIYAKAGRNHQTADAALAKVKEKNQAALDALANACTAASCRAEDVPAALDEVHDALAASHTLGTAATAADKAIGHAADRANEAAKAEGLLATAAGKARELELAASAKKAAYDSARAHLGATAAQVVAEKERLTDKVKELEIQDRDFDRRIRVAEDAKLKADIVLEQTEGRRRERHDEREAALSAFAAMVASGAASHVVVIDADRHPDDFAAPTAGLNLARQIARATDDTAGREDSHNRALNNLTSAFQPLFEVLRERFDPQFDHGPGGIVRPTATLNGDVVPIAVLHAALAEDAKERTETLQQAERRQIEQYLRDEVGDHLGNCIHAAKAQEQSMNEILRRHPTNSGATVRLDWHLDDATGENVKAAVDALQQKPATRPADASAALTTFLIDRVGMARRGELEGSDLAERLTNALDYRTWYSFRLGYKERPDAPETRMTARKVGSGSGGQQAKIAHLPLLAAAAAFYSSSPTAPRLCFLDEAFAGIDAANAADLLEFATTLDLDLVMTNFDAWFCVPQVPGLAIYHLEKLAGAVGVAAIRYEWDGTHQHMVDPWLDGS